MTEHYNLLRFVVQDCFLSSLAAGGQDVGDMRVEGRTLGASGLKSHPAGKPWNPRTGVATGAAAGQARRRAASTIGGGMDRQLIFFPRQRPPAINAASALQRRRGFCRENSRDAPSTQTWDRMSGTLIAAVQPQVGYTVSAILLDASRHRGKNSLTCAVRLLVHSEQLCVAVTELRRSARPGGAADLSETGMFDLVEVPFFPLSQSSTQERRGERTSINQYR